MLISLNDWEIVTRWIEYRGKLTVYFKLQSQAASAVEGSESERESGHSDKESMSEKDSDSTGTFQPKTVVNGAIGNINSNESNENKEKELVRKRGRRPKDSNENSA